MEASSVYQETALHRIEDLNKKLTNIVAHRLTQTSDSVQDILLKIELLKELDITKELIEVFPGLSRKRTST